MVAPNGDMGGHETSLLSLNATHLQANPLQQASNLVDLTRSQRLGLLTTKANHYLVGLNRSCEADSDEEEEDEEEDEEDEEEEAGFKDMEEVLWQGQRRLVLGTRHGTPCSFPRERISEWRSEWRSRRSHGGDSLYPSSASLPCSFPPGRISRCPAGNDSPYPSSASLPCYFPPGRASHRSAGGDPSHLSLAALPCSFPPGRISRLSASGGTEATSFTTTRPSLRDSRKLSRSCSAAGFRAPALYQVLPCSPALHSSAHRKGETRLPFSLSPDLLHSIRDAAARAPARLLVHGAALSGDRQNDQRAVGDDDSGRSNSRPYQQVRRHSDGSSAKKKTEASSSRGSAEESSYMARTSQEDMSVRDGAVSSSRGPLRRFIAKSGTGHGMPPAAVWKTSPQRVVQCQAAEGGASQAE
ncbi:unnamed protein product [Closterium sp. NIES-64]|nr:unnamed protein product [Closterium sp. NIES-64]